MKPSVPVENSASRLEFSGTETEVVVLCRGDGPTLKVLTGLVIWGAVTLGGSAFLLAMLANLLMEGADDVYVYFWTVGLMLFPVVVGVAFGVQCFQRGWNNTVVTIESDRISVRYEGKVSRQPNRFPLSDI